MRFIHMRLLSAIPAPDVNPSDLIGCDIYGCETSHHRVIASLPIEPVAKDSGLAPEDFSKMQKGAVTLRNNLIQAVRDEP